MVRRGLSLVLLVGAGLGCAGASDTPGQSGAGPSGASSVAGRGGATGGGGAFRAGSGGTGGAGAMGGRPTDWRAACGDLTLNGRCAGSTYQWCDYYAGAVHSLDCGALGMTCRANPTEPGEDDLNGCLGGSCTGADSHCDGRLKVECLSGELPSEVINP